MELICGELTCSSKHLTEPPEVTIEHYRRITQTLEVTATGNWILITLPQYILRRYMERFRNHSGTILEKPPKFDSGYTTEYIRINLIL